MASFLSNYKSYPYTVRPGSSDPFYIVIYYIQLVTTSWTCSIIFNPIFMQGYSEYRGEGPHIQPQVRHVHGVVRLQDKVL